METHGHISGYRASSCANDLDSTEWAKQLAVATTSGFGAVSASYG